MYTDFKFPTFNMDDYLASYRRNIEALAAVNQIAIEGIQAIVTRQVEVAQQLAQRNMEHASALMSDLMSSKLEEGMSRHADFVKGNFDKSISHAKEAADMFSKASTEAADLISKRVRESMDEYKGSLNPNGNTKKSNASSRR